MIKFDWVAPYGIGDYSDFIFKLEKRFESLENFDVNVKITFSEKLDGIYHVKNSREYCSEFKMPRYASESGYVNNLEINMSRKQGQWFETNYKNDDNYIFRVRSETKDGKIDRAMYGKIDGPVKVNIVGINTAIIIMKVYLNPDYTRNLEFDPKCNLFGHLSDLEQVREP